MRIRVIRGKKTIPSSSPPEKQSHQNQPPRRSRVRAHKTRANLDHLVKFSLFHRPQNKMSLAQMLTTLNTLSSTKRNPTNCNAAIETSVTDPTPKSNPIPKTRLCPPRTRRKEHDPRERFKVTKSNPHHSPNPSVVSKRLESPLPVRNPSSACLARVSERFTWTVCLDARPMWANCEINRN